MRASGKSGRARPTHPGRDREDLVLGELHRLLRRLRPCICSGIRPVDIWNSTASSPTPYSEGPSAVPSRFRPWHVAQLAWKSFLPSSTVSVVDDADVGSVAAIAAEAPA
jgi:hypothetical protein